MKRITAGLPIIVTILSFILLTGCPKKPVIKQTFKESATVPTKNLQKTEAEVKPTIPEPVKVSKESAVRESVPKTPIQPTKPAPVKPVPTIVGEVVFVNVSANKFTVKDKSGNREVLNLDENTQIKKNQKNISLKNMSIDDKVTVYYKIQADKKIDTSVTIGLSSDKKK